MAKTKVTEICVEVSNLNFKLVILAQLIAKSYLIPEVYHFHSLTNKNHIKELNQEKHDIFGGCQKLRKSD